MRGRGTQLFRDIVYLLFLSLVYVYSVRHVFPAVCCRHGSGNAGLPVYPIR